MTVPYQRPIETRSEFHARLRREDSATSISIFITSEDDQVDTQQVLSSIKEILDGALGARLYKAETVDEVLPSGHRQVTRKWYLRAPLKGTFKR